MEITLTLESIQNSHLINFNHIKNEVYCENPDGIDICSYCNSWWKLGEVPKHNSNCTNPYNY